MLFNMHGGMELFEAYWSGCIAWKFKSVLRYCLSECFQTLGRDMFRITIFVPDLCLIHMKTNTPSKCRHAICINRDSSAWSLDPRVSLGGAGQRRVVWYKGRGGNCAYIAAFLTILFWRRRRMSAGRACNYCFLQSLFTGRADRKLVYAASVYGHLNVTYVPNC